LGEGLPGKQGGGAIAGRVAFLSFALFMLERIAARRGSAMGTQDALIQEAIIFKPFTEF
jgi:hypothetical protein